jgi:putative ATPase
VGLPEAVLPLTEAALYLARAPKSNTAMTSYSAAREAIRRTGNLPVPLHLRNAPTGLARSLGHGHGYQYPHELEGAVADQQYLPDQLRGERFYEPGPRDG